MEIVTTTAPAEAACDSANRHWPSLRKGVSLQGQFSLTEFPRRLPA